MAKTIPVNTHHIRESAALLVLRVCLLVVTFELLFALFLLASPTILQNVNPNLSLTIFLIVHGIFGFLEFSVIAAFIIYRTSVEYYFNTRRLIIHRGVIRIQKETVDLQHLLSVKRRQTFIGKIFRYGDITLTITVGMYTRKVKITGIQKPKKYEKVFRDLIKREMNPQTSDTHTTHSSHE